ncbi:MAG: Uma2 family endonuclease [Pseudomarimonas sp.]
MSAVLKYPNRYAVSTEEYLRMANAGVFAAEARLELIEGEITAMAPIGSAHAGAVKTLLRLFVQRAGASAVVSVQDPLLLGTYSVPQPDLSLLAPRADDYASAHPGVADVLLVVEVADSTREFDLTTKAMLFARHGVIELWVVDVQERAVRVFREPSASGYRSSFTAVGEQRVGCLALPAVELSVAEIFPSAKTAPK